jgi:hypothetical protein
VPAGDPRLATLSADNTHTLTVRPWQGTFSVSVGGQGGFTG